MTTSVPRPIDGSQPRTGRARSGGQHPARASGVDGGSAGDAPDRPRLACHPTAAAPLLLGAHLTSTLGGTVTVRITEVEAYGGLGEDAGSHAHRRRTDRNASMFGPVGHAYVYFTYGMHWCVNVVAHEAGVAGAVLIRAGQVVDGLPVARQRRPAARTDRDLARGPARLAAALGVTGQLDGVDLLAEGSPLRLTMSASAEVPGRRLPAGGDPERSVGSGPRTGVAGDGAATPWRFWLPGEPSVSPHRPAGGRRSGGR
jgi:DNA-3-methyladenine glycosylase